MPEPSTPAPARKRSLLSYFLRALLILVVLLVVGVVAGLLWFRGKLAGSLPQTTGELALQGLAAPVTVERDGLGIPTVRGASRLDVVRALGFVHAQDRYFQMDLLRRQAAGELAALLGAPLVPADRQNRLHRFRHVAQQVVAAAPQAERELLTAYAAGVNAGLASLEEVPFEYILLRGKPEPWKPEDSLLVVYAMFFELHDEDGGGEANLARLAKLPKEMFEFVAPPGTEWDAPLVGEAYAVPPIPGPEVMDLRKGAAPALEETPKAASLLAPRPGRVLLPWQSGMEGAQVGSNNFAVAGSHTADGKALVANDMHLGISVPNTWYRASLVWPDATGERRLTGVTLAGTPILVAGSTGRIAWGFTNSYGDWTDLIDLEIDPADPESYRTPEGPKRFEKLQEQIAVLGGPPVTLEIWQTVWGPVINRDVQGEAPRALAWTAHHPRAVSLSLAGIESATTLEEAVAVAHRSGIPPQNFTVADATGRIGWTIIGQIPRRVGFDGRLPTSWADGSRRWDGWLAPEEVPVILDPPSGRIWTANNRLLDGEMLTKVGDGGYDRGPRARQIRDALLALEKATPEDLLKIQLDDRALFLERWKNLLAKTLDAKAVADHPKRQELKRLLDTTWTGRASIDSVAYRGVRGFRDFTEQMVFAGLIGSPPPQPGQPLPIYPGNQFEGALWKLVTERPAHLLDPRYESWDELLLAAADAVIGFWETRGMRMSDRTWGERNTTRIQHPFSLAVAQASRFLDMKPRPLPGDGDMPRVQGPGFGASERFVVSPGQEEKGIFHMPVGQSGHFLSPHYGDGHEAWEKGEPTPFLPGKTEETLKLVPKG